MRVVVIEVSVDVGPGKGLVSWGRMLVYLATVRVIGPGVCSEFGAPEPWRCENPDLNSYAPIHLLTLSTHRQ